MRNRNVIAFKASDCNLEVSRDDDTILRFKDNGSMEAHLTIGLDVVRNLPAFFAAFDYTHAPELSGVGSFCELGALTRQVQLGRVFVRDPNGIALCEVVAVGRNTVWVCLEESVEQILSYRLNG